MAGWPSFLSRLSLCTACLPTATQGGQQDRGGPTATAAEEAAATPSQLSPGAGATSPLASLTVPLGATSPGSCFSSGTAGCRRWHKEEGRHPQGDRILSGCHRGPRLVETSRLHSKCQHPIQMLSYKMWGPPSTLGPHSLGCTTPTLGCLTKEPHVLCIRSLTTQPRV